MPFKQLQKNPEKKTRLLWDSKLCLLDTSLAPLSTELRRHTLGARHLKRKKFLKETYLAKFLLYIAKPSKLLTVTQ